MFTLTIRFIAVSGHILHLNGRHLLISKPEKIVFVQAEWNDFLSLSKNEFKFF